MVVMAAEAPVRMRYPLAQVTYGPEEIAAVVATLESGRTTCGPRVAAFEGAFARFVGAPDAVLVNSGSSADLLLALSLGSPYPRLDEVLVPAVTWPTQAWACALAGFRVRLVDVDPHTLQMDVADLEAKLSLRTRAVFVAHILGNVGDMDAIAALATQHGVPVLEDACEALGATWKGRHVGALGGGGAFSFFFSHTLTTMEGGMVVPPVPADGHAYRLWRAHGWEPRNGERFRFPTWGLNVRPTEVQGAFGSVQLSRLEGFLEARQRNYWALAQVTYERYPVHLCGVRVLSACQPAWHGFPLLVRPEAPFDRHALCAHLERHGVETRPLVAGNLARQPAFQDDPRIVAGPLPGADLVHERAFYIGLANRDDPEGTAHVGAVVADFMEGHR